MELSSHFTLHIELEKVEARSANDDWFPVSPPKSIHEVMQLAANMRAIFS